jgi:hypothetical protein
LLYPYHLQQAQALCPLDFHPCQEFCQWFLQQCGKDPFFSSCILFTDKAGFTWNGTLNFHNRHIWSDVNPHNTFHSRYNVWNGIAGDSFVGPHYKLQLPSEVSLAHVIFITTVLISL